MREVMAISVMACSVRLCGRDLQAVDCRLFQGLVRHVSARHELYGRMVTAGISRQLTDARWQGQNAIYTLTCREHGGSIAIYVLPQHQIICLIDMSI